MLEINLEMLPSLPHDGQVDGASALRLCNFSKTCSHSEHLNSYNGMIGPRAGAHEQNGFAIRSSKRSITRELFVCFNNRWRSHMNLLQTSSLTSNHFDEGKTLRVSAHARQSPRRPREPNASLRSVKGENSARRALRADFMRFGVGFSLERKNCSLRHSG